ncbi:unnamed protein product [Schistocephalus solidus]|uniref:Protein lin-37 homolog n=1 Tax=Schistocephalus solidus TaxID=70667 RepID=A0A3P7D2T3_SCHSO|nr:unnamed protein product [Schistocephalus solidus]
MKYKDEVVNRKEELDKDKFRSPHYKVGGSEIKRRKRGPNSDDEDNYKESFVIKVFERSVDFGQFGENSPLYPMARAWIRNLNQSDTSSWNDIPNQEEEREGNDQLPDCHYALPKPNDGLSDNEVRVPPPLPSPGQPFVINVENPPKEMSPEGLLEQHITRWREIRRKCLKRFTSEYKRLVQTRHPLISCSTQAALGNLLLLHDFYFRWKGACRENEERYRDSYIILKEMYDKFCKDLS